MGYRAIATGNSSIALGYNAKAVAAQSVSIGQNNTATGNQSVAMGYSNTTTGSYSTAMGKNNQSNGTASSTNGEGNIANAYASTVVGIYNDTTLTTMTSSYGNYPLFVVGNGNANNARSNALSVYKKGEVVINDAYSLPTIDGGKDFILTTNGFGTGSWVPSFDLGVIFENDSNTIRLKTGYDSINFLIGSPKINYDNNINHSSKMFFHKKKCSFRAGKITNKNWDLDSLGFKSFAFGEDTKAKGEVSFAMGFKTQALALNSVAFGQKSIASGVSSMAVNGYTESTGGWSFAMGRITLASGNNSLATGNKTISSGKSSSSFGEKTIASGENSITMGYSTKASGKNSLALGDSTQVIGENSLSSGHKNVSSGLNSVSMGRNDSAIGISAISTGSFTVASGDNSATMGYKTKSVADNCLSVGKYNVGGINSLFEVGYGTNGNRKNAFYVVSSGETYTRHIRPMSNNTFDLGATNLRYDDAYINYTYSTSDTTKKTNIEPLPYGLSQLMQVNTIRYNWKDDANGEKSIGFNESVNYFV